MWSSAAFQAVSLILTGSEEITRQFVSYSLRKAEQINTCYDLQSLHCQCFFFFLRISLVIQHAAMFDKIIHCCLVFATSTR